MARILRAAGTTALLVTHDPDEAATIADRVVRMGDLGKDPGMEVVTLAAAETHELRRRVLRGDDPAATVVFDGDDDPGTVHLGVRDADPARSSPSPRGARRPGPVHPAPTDRQLRGMAVDDGLRGSGIGAMLLAAGVQRAFDDGAPAVWANARDTALASTAATASTSSATASSTPSPASPPPHPPPPRLTPPSSSVPARVSRAPDR